MGAEGLGGGASQVISKEQSPQSSVSPSVSLDSNDPLSLSPFSGKESGSTALGRASRLISTYTNSNDPFLRIPHLKDPCVPKLRRWLCQECKVWVQTEKGCDGLACPRCAKKAGLMRKQRIWERMGDIARPWFAIVPTLPSEVWGVVTNSQLRTLRSRIAAFLRDWLLDCAGIGWRGRKSWSAGFWEATHPAGDLQPDRFQPHFNFVGPLLVMNIKARKAEFVKMRRTGAELLDLIERWTATVNEVLGTDFPVVDIHYQWKDTRAKKHHSASYNSRAFPEWHKQGVNRIRWYGFLSIRTGKKIARPILEELGLIRIEWKSREEPCEDLEVPQCSNCGGPMVLFSYQTATEWRSRKEAG